VVQPLEREAYVGDYRKPRNGSKQVQGAPAIRKEGSAEGAEGSGQVATSYQAVGVETALQLIISKHTCKDLLDRVQPMLKEKASEGKQQRREMPR
jgi:hypothetical protein